MKSSSRLTGRPGGLTLQTMGDSLVNVMTGMGGAGDRGTHAEWRRRGGNEFLDRIEVASAYMTNWLIAKIHDIPPEDMTKAWRAWSGSPEQIEALEAEEARLALRPKIETCLREGLFGGCALIMGLPGQPNTPAPLPKDIGEGDLRYLMPMGRWQLSTPEWNDDLEPPEDPRAPQFNEPLYFGFDSERVKIHPSRVIIFPGLPVPLGAWVSRTEKFWGRPWLERLNDAMKRAETAQHNIADLLHDLKTDVISIPGLTAMVSTAEGAAGLSRRMEVAKEMASQFAVKLLDGGTPGEEHSGEEWDTRETTTTGLPDLMMGFIQMAAGASDLPMSRLTGMQAKGLNNGGEQDEANHMENMRTRQNTQLRPRLDKVDGYLKASAGIDPEDAKVTWTFGDLKKMDPKAEAEIDKLIAEVVKILAESGVVPEDGLLEAYKAKMIDRGTWPGFEKAMEEAVEEIPGLREARLAEEGMQAANENESRKVEIAAKGVGAMGRARAVSRDALMLDAAPRSLYVSRKVLNPQEVLRHFRAQNVPNLIVAGDLHVTIIASTNEVDWMQIPADWASGTDGRLRLPPGGPRVVERLGPKFLVQHFASGDLGWRFQQLVDFGVRPKFSDPQWHITIAAPPADYDASALTPYTGRIVLGPEIFEEIVEDWLPATA